MENGLLKNLKYFSLIKRGPYRKPLVLIGLLLVGMFFIINNTNSNVNATIHAQANITENVTNLNTLALATHAAISINGNSGFKACGCTTGNGTKTNPYVIQNYFINNASSNGISIANTNAYFTILNVNTNGTQGAGGGFGAPGNGIILNNVANGNLSFITANYNPNSGIQLISVSNITIENSIFNYNNADAGIEIETSNDSVIIANTINSNLNWGFIFDSSSNFNISKNTVSGNLRADFLIQSSTHNVFNSNTADNSAISYGFDIESSNNNTFSYNTAQTNNQTGMYIYQSNYNILIGNKVSDTSLFVATPPYVGTGIYLDYSNYSTLIDNYANNNGFAGFYIENSASAYLVNNTANSNYCSGGGTCVALGFEIYLVDNTVLINNTATGNTGNAGSADISISSSINVAIWNNTASTMIISGTTLDYRLNSISNASSYAIYENGTLVNSGMWTAGANIPFDTSALSPGTYNITVVISDFFGVISSETDFITVPLPPLDTVIDQTVLTNGISWIATSPNASTYKILENGTMVAYGSWLSGKSVFFNDTSLSPGLYNITVVFIDSYGRVDSQSVIFSIQAPQVPITNNITQTTTQTVTQQVTTTKSANNSSSQSTSATKSTPGETAVITLISLISVSVIFLVSSRRKK